MTTITRPEPTAAEVVIYNHAMQRIDAILGKPLRLIHSRAEYEAQRDELAELLETRWRVYEADDRAHMEGIYEGVAVENAHGIDF